ncbi:MAG3720 family protein [Mycoplasmopsis alligatoris]|uniref:Cell division protein FtsA n=1 Tax=Mycoplasmopsis alligatoris A21JP2 TaxID=747682 RepID=D4XUX7_9BACT|nr:hypothetical protein [Mycoplasmopsis alligatoris]EFF41802.1 hypothetical protein MALL_0134 [Mycoplasmopsis alligatoris A21JP2]
MNRFFLIFRISKQNFKWSFIKYKNANYFLLNEQDSIKVNSVDELNKNLQTIEKFVLSHASPEQIKTTVVFDDDQLQGLSIKTTNVKLAMPNNIAKINVKNELTTKLENSFNLNFSNVLNYNPYLYKVTTIEDDHKEYDQFPLNKPAKSLEVLYSVLHADQASDLDNLKKLFNNYKFGQVSFNIKTLTLTSHLKAYDSYNLVIDLNQDYLAVAICNKGSALKYSKTLVGSRKILNRLSKATNLKANDVLNRIKTLEQNPTYSQNFDIKNLQIIKEELNYFLKDLEKFIYEFVDLKQIKNKIEFNVIAFSGVLARYLSNNFNLSELKHKRIQTLEAHQNLMLFECSDLSTTGALNLANNYSIESMSKIDTLTSHYSINPKKTPMQRLKDFFVINKTNNL